MIKNQETEQSLVPSSKREIVHLPVLEEKDLLPTKKGHLSYSEAMVYHECSFRHKLIYIDGMKDNGNEHTAYGGLIHETLEDWLTNCSTEGYLLEEKKEETRKKVLEAFALLDFNPPDLEKNWISSIGSILEEVPRWLNNTFPGWILVAAELALMEPIEDSIYSFKGFVDCVIKVPNEVTSVTTNKVTKESEYTYWVLDWKVTSWGWAFNKKTDKYKRMQLALYKHYFSVKMGIPLKNIKCGFVLLKRTNKKTHVELIEVSVGDKTREDALDFISRTLHGISSKIYYKNRNSCTYCKFYQTDHCY